jgi:hypothetical protein
MEPAAEGGLPPDMHGIVTTYQQVAACAPLMGRLAAGSMAVFDEIHHAGDDRAWGAAIRSAFDRAAFRLCLSGTPFRSDTRSIPFLSYELDEARPDYEYGYGDALAGGRVVRPIFFPRTGGEMEWSAPDGSTWAAAFDDPLDALRANQRLRAALSLDGDWLPAVLHSADDRLLGLRRHHPDAGGLVIATDQDHARGIARALEWRHGVKPVLVLSDDAGASDRIARFAGSDAPWLVAVRMVSEGVDIPRLRVGVYATTTTTELFFRQAVGRLVRWTPGLGPQHAYLFIPDDARLRAWAYRIAEIRRHCLRRDESYGPGDGGLTPEPGPGDRDGLPVEPPADGDQLSLFAVISAVATDLHEPEPPADAGPGPDPYPEDDLVVDLPILEGAAAVGAGPVLTRREHKARLRNANADLARALVHKTGWPHAKVNAELNRLAGIRRVTEATVEQLERRLRQAEHWYRRL